MMELTVFVKDRTLWTGSREVAEMIDKEHAKLLRDIRTYCDYLTEAKVGLSDFFIESSYTDSTGRTLPCYLLSRKGCEMVANKLIGRKGVLFTAAYITCFDEMEKKLQETATTYLPSSTEFATAAFHLALYLSQYLYKCKVSRYDMLYLGWDIARMCAIDGLPAISEEQLEQALLVAGYDIIQDIRTGKKYVDGAAHQPYRYSGEFNRNAVLAP